MTQVSPLAVGRSARGGCRRRQTLPGQGRPDNLGKGHAKDRSKDKSSDGDEGGDETQD